MARNINIGKVALKFCGLWDNITAYNAFDCVNNNNNSSFVALKDVPLVHHLPMKNIGIGRQILMMSQMQKLPV